MIHVPPAFPRRLLNPLFGSAFHWSPQRAALATTLLSLLALAIPAAPARANRFGPPWQAVIMADQATVYAEPDPSSPPVGPLPRGAIVVVLGEQTTGDDSWTQLPVGYVPSSSIAELRGPWVAEVSVDSVSVYAKPDVTSGVRRTAKRGDLLRVFGVSPDLSGNGTIWWATSEGYVGLSTLRQATSPEARGWTMPSPADAPGGWWGSINSPATVRVAPSTSAPIVGQLGPGAHVKVLAEEQGDEVDGSSTWYRIDGGRFAGGRVHSSLVDRLPPPRPNTTPIPDSPAQRWIVVDRSAFTLTLVQDGQPIFTTYVALGKAGRQTPTGVYATAGKIVADDMTSRTVPDAEHPYDLPNVPYTQYYRSGGYAIHGTYWHDAFGTQQSQGCINLTWADAAYLFGQTEPQVGLSDDVTWAAPGQATPVLILD